MCNLSFVYFFQICSMRRVLKLFHLTVKPLFAKGLCSVCLTPSPLLSQSNLSTQGQAIILQDVNRFPNFNNMKGSEIFFVLKIDIVVDTRFVKLWQHMY